MSENKCNVEVFARVTGFFRPVQTWNKGKTSEFSDRKNFSLEDARDSVEQDADSRFTKSVSG